MLSEMASTTHERRSTMKAILSLLAVSLAAVALAVTPAAAEDYIPGVTDFPKSAEQSERYVPGVTDFPSRAAEIRSVEAGSVYRSDGFDWLDAGFGAAIGIALGALAGASLIALRRRTAPTPA
jgi:hypothetical protein